MHRSESRPRIPSTPHPRAPRHRRRAARLAILLLALLAALLLPACSTAGGGGTPTGSVDAYIASLPDWSEASPLEQENDGEPVGDTSDPDDTLVDGQIYRCSTQTYSLTKNPTDIVMADPNAGIVWPGALIQGASHLDGNGLQLLALDRSRRAPLGISVQGGGVLGIRGGVSTVVEQPVASTVREGINQLIANALDSDVAVGNGFSQFTSSESFSGQQAALEAGFSARYLGAEASGRLDYSREANQYAYTATFIQRLYTISIDQPESAASFFDPSLTGSDLAALGVDGNNLPLYISDVSYGRILMYSFVSSDSRERIEAALEFSYNSPVGGVDGYAEAELEQTLSNAKIEILAVGGPNTGVSNLIRSGDLASYFEAPLEVNQVEPISFTLRNLGNNSLARVSNTTEYEVETCEALPGATLPAPVHHWTADGDGADAYLDTVGDVHLNERDDVEIGAGRFDRGFVFDGTYGYLNTYPTEVLLDRTSLFTFSAWVNPRSSSGVHTIISQLGQNRSDGDYAFRVIGDRLQFLRRPNDDSNTVEYVESAAGAVPSGRWSHVVATYGVAAGSNTSMQIYVDGEPMGGTVLSGTYTPVGEAIQLTRIGSAELIVPCNGQCAPRFPFAGAIDELMVFDRPLSESEVLTLYQNFDVFKD